MSGRYGKAVAYSRGMKMAGSRYSPLGVRAGLRVSLDLGKGLYRRDLAACGRGILPSVFRGKSPCIHSANVLYFLSRRRIWA